MAKKRAELLFLIWRCDEGVTPERIEQYRKRWIGQMANCHCTPCSCFMCGNWRRFHGGPTLAEKRSTLSMLDILEDGSDMTA
ncbi:MAG: hypothetical protein IJJ28_03995 [Lentisphaeria bacterium]|nr:hypothetical protein [Lentisphaeria bacterium]